MDKDPFVTRLTELASDLIRATDSGKGSVEGFEPNRNLLPHELYFYSCFQGMGSIHTLIRQLDQAVIFFSSFRSTKAMKNKSITRFDHMVYHLENYVLRVTGVLDRMLIFTNQILRLGLEEASCKPHMMLTGKNGKKGVATIKIEAVPGLFEALDGIRMFVDGYRNQRNEVAHARRWEAPDMREIEMYHIVMANTNDLELIKREFIIKRETDEKMWAYKAQMLEANLELKKLIGQSFKILQGCFEAKYANLKT